MTTRPGLPRNYFKSCRYESDSRLRSHSKICSDTEFLFLDISDNKALFHLFDEMDVLQSNQLPQWLRH